MNGPDHIGATVAGILSQASSARRCNKQKRGFPMVADSKDDVRMYKALSESGDVVYLGTSLAEACRAQSLHFQKHRCSVAVFELHDDGQAEKICEIAPGGSVMRDV
jgi:hypothetical protein